ELLDRGFAKLGATSKDVLVAEARTNIPVPGRKPDTGKDAPETVLAMNATPEMTGTMGELAGEGDIDPAIARRFETGMMAIAAIKGEIRPGAGSRTAETTSPEPNIQ